MMCIDVAAIFDDFNAGGGRRRAAVACIYRAYSPYLFARYKPRLSRGEIDELLQDVFEKLLRTRSEFRGRSEGELKRWLVTIADNLLADAGRSGGDARRAVEQAADIDDEAVQIADSQPQPEQNALNALLADCVSQGYARFAQEHAEMAEALHLQIYQELSVDEVIAALGSKRSNGAMREYLSQCRKKVLSFINHCR